MNDINKSQKNELEHLANFYHNQLLTVKRNIQISFIQMGETLYNIKNQNLYQFYLQPDGGLFEQYLALPEISIKYSTAMQLIRIYKKFVVELGVSKDEIMSIDYYKLDMIIPYVNKNNYEELLEKAESLDRYGLRENLKESKKITFEDEPSEFEKNIVNTKRCPYGWDCPHLNKPVTIQLNKEEWENENFV